MKKNKRIEMDQIPHSTGTQEELSIDIAIVGAGVSGLYTGYRLLSGDDSDNTYSPTSVHIFDLNHTIGGRLLSVNLPGMDIIGELGGMRYLTSQKITTSLIENIFKLDHAPFPGSDSPNNFFYLRGQRFRADIWSEMQKNDKKFKIRYFINDDIQGYSASQLFNKIIYDVLVADPWFKENYGNLVEKTSKYDYKFKISLRQWDIIKKNITYIKKGSPYDKMKVKDIGFWNLIKDQVGQEGYNFLSDAGGYYSNTINWNAAESMSYMVGDFTQTDIEYRTIKNGYDQLAYALAKAYTDQNGAKLWLKNTLITFQHNNGGNRRYSLKFRNENSQTDWTVHTDTIILAMPKQSLNLLDQYNFFFDKHSHPKLNKNINTVIPEPSLKLLMGFEYPWWNKQFNTKSGASITDLAIRQCYYFGTDDKNSHSLFLSSYNDMRAVTFWKALIQIKDKDSIYEPCETSIVSKEKLKESPLPGEPVSKHLVEEAMNQVKELHGIDIPPPYIARIQDWSKDPYGGGYHAWKVGVSVDEVMPFMRHPIKNESVHIIGEAYSGDQGWTEGAFCVTEKLLQEIFRLNWPEWLDKEYYLGR
ncbi:FAD-dependent oxidoreductase [Xenorhabdus sp. PB30.3]|uniref:flavin monoamine oxidase family protein n=1 Tax=Xenorhabdus sp. PB30.3 TaxID=2788941 RepID=UPI001E4A316B|nr:FAD-dependent oxidoreductase [Xenorhabdus sp. PB30.3]MCC8380654.1 FAD-dependent oxidoreductase [Xenorhabdus sp. PB30.3]